MATTPVAAERADAQESAAAGAGILPLAVPDAGALLDGSENYNDLLSGFSTILEAFQSVSIAVATDNGGSSREARQRSFFVTASIPGLPERIPLFGLKESRMKENNNIYLKHDILLFNGNERVKTGQAFYSVKNNVPQEFHLFSNDGNHNILTGTVFNGATQVYDNQGRSVHNFLPRKVKKKKKTRLTFEARETNSSRRKIADIDIDFERIGWDGRKLREARIDFTDVVDYVSKPQVVMSSFLLIYSNKMI